MRENNAILQTYVVLCFFHNKNNNYTFFYLALTHLPKFQRGQGQISAILLAIKFLKVILKALLTNSPGANLAYLALLDNFSWVPFFLLGPP